MAVSGRNRIHVTVPDSYNYQIKDGELFRLYDPDDSLKEEYKDIFTFLELNDDSNQTYKSRCTHCAFNDFCYLERKYHIPACFGNNRYDGAYGIFCTPEYYQLVKSARKDPDFINKEIERQVFRHKTI